MSDVYPLSIIISIFTFSLAAAITPGPNNIMLVSSGMVFGYKKSIAHILGIVVGFPIMVILIGLGMGALFQSYPSVLSVLKIIGFVYLLWMAYKIATNTSDYTDSDTSNKKPFSFMQAMLFQWVNPKAWVYAITSISIFVTDPKHTFEQVIVLSSIFLLTAFISTNTWALGGVVLKRFIKNPKNIHRLNLILATLLIVSITPLLFG